MRKTGREAGALARAGGGLPGGGGRGEAETIAEVRGAAEGVALGVALFIQFDGQEEPSRGPESPCSPERSTPASPDPLSCSRSRPPPGG